MKCFVCFTLMITSTPGSCHKQCLVSVDRALLVPEQFLGLGCREVHFTWRDASAQVTEGCVGENVFTVLAGGFCPHLVAEVVQEEVI